MNLNSGIRVDLLDGREWDYDLNWGGAGKIMIRDDFSRLYMLKSGAAEVTLKEKKVHLQPGKLYLFPCGVTARYRCIKVMRLCWVHFRIEHLPGIDLFSRFDPPRELRQGTSSEADFSNLLAAFESAGPGGLVSGLSSLLLLIKDFLPEKWDALSASSPSVLRLAPALEYIRAKFADPDLSLKHMAASVHLQPTYFSNLFQSVLGITPVRLLGELRMRHARFLLLNTDLTVGEISVRCGYSDQFYFTRVFKKFCGVNPRQFRETPEIFGAVKENHSHLIRK